MGTAPIPVYTEFFVRYVWVYIYLCANTHTRSTRARRRGDTERRTGRAGAPRFDGFSFFAALWSRRVGAGAPRTPEVPSLRVVIDIRTGKGARAHGFTTRVGRDTKL